MTKQESECKIENLARSFFAIAKDDENLVNAREKLRTKFITELYKYCRDFQYAKRDKNGYSDTEKYSCEIFTAIISCIKSFDINGSPFLNFFNKAVSHEIKKGRKSEREDHGGIKIPVRIKSDAEILRKEIGNMADQKEVLAAGKRLGWTEDRTQAAYDVCRIQVISENTINSDGKEVSNFDAAAAKQYFQCGSQENRFFQNAENIRFLQNIEDEFLKKQKRIQEYLAALLTRYFTSKKSEKKYGINLLNIDAEILRRFKFVNGDLLQEICENPRLKRQEIASRFKRDKTDASRTLREFLKKI